MEGKINVVSPKEKGQAHEKIEEVEAAFFLLG